MTEVNKQTAAPIIPGVQPENIIKARLASDAIADWASLLRNYVGALASVYQQVNSLQDEKAKENGSKQMIELKEKAKQSETKLRDALNNMKDISSFLDLL